MKRNNDNKKKQKKNDKILMANSFVWNVLVTGCRVVLNRKIKIKLINKVGKLDRPAIVLCNHGSFIDFAYAGILLKKERPHFIVARLYFYHKLLGKVLRYMGCIPKSMFSNDIANVRGCMKVLKSGGVLAMMPEARLSTVGKFEGIQDSTYSFIQRCAVAVYTVHIDGDYLANPKWGNGMRKGSYVEATLKPLFKAGETKELTLEEVKKRIDQALSYNELDWLKTKPEIKYQSKTIAEGLENILYICPKCGSRYSLKAKGNMLTCECCDLQAHVGNRYEFVDENPFVNFRDWYEWQVAESQKEIVSGGYRLESKVELRHGSKDGKRCTRHAGEGVCVLDQTGLTYIGTRDGETIEKFFPMSRIYRLLFGAGEDFEIYEGTEIWYFRPENLRSCVEWYVASELLKEAEEN